jgi:acetyltransferase EpsM
MVFNILGTGGHSRVIIDICKLSKMYDIQLFDDNSKNHNTELYGFKIIGGITNQIVGNSIMAIGSNKVRNHFNEYLTNVIWTTLIHPSAVISENVKIGMGTVIMAGAIIQPGAKIGRHCIINTGACVDHDCIIEDFVHLAPNTALAGGVTVGEGTFVGIGSSVVPYVTIGKWSTIGAGSAVINDIPDNCMAAGVPAVIKKILND